MTLKVQRGPRNDELSIEKKLVGCSILNCFECSLDLFFEIFGEKGKHVRAAVGVIVLPFNSPLEIEFIFEVS